ncbi:MAG: hypothetical protein AVO35_09490 [Candidatus Aegiribacteria sp. MLS_C]|nr:MAG: hypothetical protein AVO35_09490 [Candidatus Aegiribacteria sp. MLS_C]
MLVYAAGDTAASLILSQFMLSRLAGMMLVGGCVYALEIPRYFRFIQRRTAGMGGLSASLARTGFALLYFNPLWIARHLLFIAVFSFEWRAVSPELLRLGLLSFTVNIPVTFAANYSIQNRISLEWRFLASAVFSSLMAVYYALSRVLF